MSLPTFLGIGAQKAGTTWLHTLLNSHPDVYMPTKRKEVHYFDWHYHKGLSWYERFFPADAEGRFKAVGEISPDYLFEAECAPRIHELLPSVQLIVILRHPIQRAFSQYKMHLADFNWKISFEEAIELRPDIIERGKYAKQLQPYLSVFSPEQLLVLIFEDAVADVESTKQCLSKFLLLDPDRFPVNAGHDNVFGSYSPKYRRLFSAAKWLSFQLHKYDVDWIVEGAKRLGVRQMFVSGGDSLQPMLPETEKHLKALYAADILKLESLVGRPLVRWRS